MFLVFDVTEEYTDIDHIEHALLVQNLYAKACVAEAWAFAVDRSDVDTVNVTVLGALTSSYHSAAAVGGVHVFRTWTQCLGYLAQLVEVA